MESTDIRYLTPEELAEKLRVNKTWIYQHTHMRGPDAIPRVRLGKYLRFDEAAVLEWIRKRQPNAND